MEEHERGPSWVAQKVGYTREWISYVLHGKKPFSDQLARKLQETLGVQFDDLPRARRATHRHTTTKAAKS
jgi:hypothetical protein